MPQDDPNVASADPKNSQPDASTSRSASHNLFRIPAPIKRIFNRFPLLSYPANELPLRAPRARTQHALYVFQVHGANVGLKEASCNPSCLKWQTYLKLLNIPFISVPSNNHASPSGSLPFLLPALSSKNPTNQKPSPIPTSKLLKWSRTEAKAADEESDIRFEAYQTLLDVRIRKAWSFQLYHLYLCPANFFSVAAPCYIRPSSSNSLVGAALAYELRAAATAEIVKSSSTTAPVASHVIDAEALYIEAEDAFRALSTLLGRDQWFFGAAQAGLMDACVFAYTHLLLDDTLGWSDQRLNDDLRKYNNLVQHRKLLMEQYF
ncbi:MAG: hypothetical protein M1821_006501 [Bathelium mastoideum]|nr:MAG: hypothetical protein M1821_006501 [Bathelium mastoideum]